MTQPSDVSRTTDRRPIRVLHVIPTLDCGGAETNLLRLVGRLESPSLRNEILTMRPGGELRSQFDEIGIPVHQLRVMGSVPSPAATMALVRYVRMSAPDVVQGWLVHGNLAALVGGKSTRPRAPVVWGIRQGLQDFDAERQTTRAAIRAAAWLSPLAHRIVYNSKMSASDHVRRGYAKHRTLIIPNGFDADAFSPNDDARTQLRAELGLSADSLIVGMVARFHQNKDHATFFDAAMRLRELSGLDLHFVLAGSGIDTANEVLRRWATRPELQGRIHLLGRRANLSSVYPAMDVLALTSRTEAFPNVLGEAMLCGVPCVSTAVGDAGEIVSRWGRVVPVGNAEAVASAIAELLGAEPAARRQFGMEGRNHIEHAYSIAAATAAYRELYEEAALHTRRRTPDRYESCAA